MTEKVKKVAYFLEGAGFNGTQTFDTRNFVGDPMETIYNEDGIQVDYCRPWDYLEVFGLSDEEYADLRNYCHLT